MKRLLSVLLVLLLSLSFAGCTQQETIYTVSKNGMDFQVNREEKTVSEGDNRYRYEFTGDSASFHVTITYPNGSSYWYSQSGTIGQGGWSDDYAEGTYTSGDILVEVLQEQAPRKANPGKTIGAIAIIVLGLMHIAFPKVPWYLGYGWRYKNAKPSNAALVVARISGVVITVMGIVLAVI